MTDTPTFGLKPDTRPSSVTNIAELMAAVNILINSKGVLKHLNTTLV
jgi:hypothetical protein